MKYIDEKKKALFEALIKEDCCASDFSGFVPEKAGNLNDEKDDEESQNS